MIVNDRASYEAPTDLHVAKVIEKETVEVKSIEEALMNADKANRPSLTTTLIGALCSDGGYMK